MSTLPLKMNEVEKLWIVKPRANLNGSRVKEEVFCNMNSLKIEERMCFLVDFLVVHVSSDYRNGVVRFFWCENLWFGRGIFFTSAKYLPESPSFWYEFWYPFSWTTKYKVSCFPSNSNSVVEGKMYQHDITYKQVMIVMMLIVTIADIGVHSHIFS